MVLCTNPANPAISKSVGFGERERERKPDGETNDGGCDEIRPSIGAAACPTGREEQPGPNQEEFLRSSHDDAYETAKWEKITYAGIVTCTILSIYNLSKGHPHHEEPPAYPYLHIRNKEFPWGPDGLFEAKHHAEH